MTGVRYLILLSLILVIFGCFAQQSHLSLPGTDTIAEPIAILPVIPAHIIMPADSEEEYVKMAENTNSVLDTLAGGSNSKLLGPKKVRKILDESDIESLHRILDDLGDHARIWKSERLAEISGRLEVEKIIRVKVDIIAPPAYWVDGWGGGGLGKEWRGWFDVSADLFGMSPPRLIEWERMQERFGGKTGVNCLPIWGPCILPLPYSFGTTGDRALDKAVREVIAGLLKKPTEDNIDSDPVGEQL